MDISNPNQIGSRKEPKDVEGWLATRILHLRNLGRLYFFKDIDFSLELPTHKMNGSAKLFLEEIIRGSDLTTDDFELYYCRTVLKKGDELKEYVFAINRFKFRQDINRCTTKGNDMSEFDRERFTNFSIQLDCPPDNVMADILIARVLVGTPLSVDDFDQSPPFFGQQVWTLKKGSEERDANFTKSKVLFEERIVTMYKLGLIRFGSW